MVALSFFIIFFLSFLHTILFTTSILSHTMTLVYYHLGGSKKTWRTRWVVLKNHCLYYFKKKDDDSPCGIVPLDKTIAQVTESGKKKSKDQVSSTFFEIISVEVQKDGKRKPVRGCKTNSKGMVVAGLYET